MLNTSLRWPLNWTFGAIELSLSSPTWVWQPKLECFPGGFGALELPAGAFPVSNSRRRWQKWFRGPGNQSSRMSINLWEGIYCIHPITLFWFWISCLYQPSVSHYLWIILYINCTCWLWSSYTGGWPIWYGRCGQATNGRATNGSGAPSEEIQGKSWYYGPIRYSTSIHSGWIGGFQTIPIRWRCLDGFRME